MQRIVQHPSFGGVQLPDMARQRLAARYTRIQQVILDYNEGVADMACAVGMEGPVKYDPETGMITMDVTPDGQPSPEMPEA